MCAADFSPVASDMPHLPKSSITASRASGITWTEPAKGWSMATMTSSPEKIRSARTPVIIDCARRFSVPKKNVNATVRSPPPKSTSTECPARLPTPQPAWRVALGSRSQADEEPRQVWRHCERRMARIAAPLCKGRSERLSCSGFHGHVPSPANPQRSQPLDSWSSVREVRVPLLPRRHWQAYKSSPQHRPPEPLGFPRR